MPSDSTPSLKNVLYYLAPDVELGDPLFRFGSYKHILFPEISSLLDCDSEFQVGMILPRSVYETAKGMNLIDERIRYFCAEYTGVLDDLREYNAELDLPEVEQRKQWLRSLVTDFRPDIILAYEKPVDFLKACFPSACVINVMFGAFSRAPFPTLASYDPVGLFGRSFLALNREGIRAYRTTEREKEFLRSFRRKSADAIAKFQPFKRYVTELKQKFSKTLLVACQVDNYFAVSATSKYRSQFDMVRDICRNVNEDIGVLVTQHAYRQAITAEQANLLRSEFPNFVLFENNDNVPDVSQYLTPYMDGVATVSSSLAFQAALWRVPVVAMGESHINVVASAVGTEAIEPTLYDRLDTDVLAVENALAFILLRYNVLYRSTIFKGDAYAKYLRRIHTAFRDDPTGHEYFFNREIEVDSIECDYSTAFTKYKLETWFKERPNSYSPDYLLLELSRHKVASFDLFDTLLQRPLVEPHEVFLIMEPTVRRYLNNRNFPFHSLRREAEANVRRPTRGEYEVTLEDIYHDLARLSGISNEQAEHVMRMEVDYEISLCSTKPMMTIYFHFAQMLCEKTGIVSDFYMEESVVRGLIEKNRLLPDFLYVSATTKTRKHNGSIYPVLKRDLGKLGYKSSDILHIGDNVIADKNMAEANGIKGYHFPKAVDNFARSHLNKLFGPAVKRSGLSSSVVLGLISNRFYGASWNQIDADSYFRGDPFLLGYIGYGPLILGFCQWLRRQREVKGFDKFYFLARDGYIVKKVYETLYGPSPDNVYMYSSRRAATVASLQTLEQIVELAYQPFNSQPLDTYLNNRFGFKILDKHVALLKKHGLRENSIVTHSCDMQRIVGLLSDISEEILQNAEEERNAYVHYLDQIGYTDNLLKGGRSALIDIGYSGTMQYYLMRMLPETPVSGLYMLTHHHAREYFPNINFEGYLANLDDHRIAFRHKLNDHVFIFEAGLSAPEGSLLRFNRCADSGNSTPEFVEACEEIGRKCMLRQVHRGIHSFAQDYNRNLSGDIDVVAISPLLAEKTLLEFSEYPSNRDAGIFYGSEVENLFGGGSVCLIEPVDMSPGSGVPSEAQAQELVRRSKWKQGARALYEKRLSDSRRTTVPSSKDQALRRPSSTTAARKNKKLGKLINNPYSFFNDSRYAALRPLKYLFSGSRIGRINWSLIRRMFA